MKKIKEILLSAAIIAYSLLPVLLFLSDCNNQKSYDTKFIAAPLWNEKQANKYCFTSIDGIITSDHPDIVAIGEVVHGSGTIFELKYALFKHLVENYGYRTLCYEFSFEQSLDIDRYLSYGEGDIDSVMSAQYWIQSNNELMSLLKWMRGYNSTKPENEKLHFVGIDNQLDMFKPGRLGYHIKKTDYNLFYNMEDILEKIKEYGKPEYRKMRDNLYIQIESDIKQAIDIARDYFSQNPEDLKSRNDDIILHLLKSALISHQFLYSVYNDGPNNRDKFMSDNVLWAADCYNEGGKTILWAHNAHIKADPDYYGSGCPSMGMILRKTKGDEYLIIGTAFSRGNIIAVESDLEGEDTPPHIITLDTIHPLNSVNHILNRYFSGDFIIDLDKIKPGSELYIMLDSVRPFLGAGDFYTGNMLDHYNYYSCNLLKEYDVIMYLDRIGPITMSEDLSNKSYR